MSVIDSLNRLAEITTSESFRRCIFMVVPAKKLGLLVPKLTDEAALNLLSNSLEKVEIVEAPSGDELGRASINSRQRAIGVWHEEVFVCCFRGSAPCESRSAGQCRRRYSEGSLREASGAGRADADRCAAFDLAPPKHRAATHHPRLRLRSSVNTATAFQAAIAEENAQFRRSCFNPTSLCPDNQRRHRSRQAIPNARYSEQCQVWRQWRERRH
jgi:hypothetical protein